MTPKRWILKDVPECDISELTKELKISKLLAKILVSRGLREPLSVLKFLKPKLTDLHDPFLMKDMDKAVDRVLVAIDKKEKITVYGDYDVDGITSTAILYNFLSKLGGNIDCHIPDRSGEGYGLSIKTLNEIINSGTKLIISVDCGVSALEEVDFVNKNNSEIIITDHHRCSDSLPNAYAVVNPHREDCEYPFKNLAGVGVAFKMITAICMRLDSKNDYLEHLDLVALGTVADVVPLVDENRIIVKHGLELINKTKNIGLKKLLDGCDMASKNVTAYNVAFILAPKINAAGRIGDATRAVNLFIGDNEDDAKKIVSKFLEENRYRQETENKILKEAIQIIEKDNFQKSKKILILQKEGWHDGIIGIVASRIKEIYHKPTILISIKKGVGKGSGRSVEGVNLFEALSDSSELLENFGGHELAAGLSIKIENIELFDKKINAYADKYAEEDFLIPKVKIDAKIEKSEFCKNNVTEIAQMEPFGAGNPAPVFIFNNFAINSIINVGDNKHLKIRLRQDDFYIESIGFNMGYLRDEFTYNDSIDAVFGLEINSWNSNETLQLNLKDIRKTLKNQ